MHYGTARAVRTPVGPDAGAEVTVRSGELFAGRYLLEDRLGEGGMGVVHRAHDQRLRRQVALKVMRSELGDDLEFRARFEREAAAAAGFEHPHVVPVHDYAEHDGTLYLVMRFVPGRDLRQELAATGPLDLRRTVDLLGQIAAGLSAGHRNQLVHRDVKPANVLLERGPDGHERALLTDFGLAQPQSAGRGLTSTGLLLGTVAYMSPEQLQGQRASPRSDVYALACVAYECLTGRPPFTGATEVQTAQGHLSDPVPDPRSWAPDLPQAVVPVLLRGLAKTPEQRYGSAEEFAADLAQAATGRVERVPDGGTRVLRRTALLPEPVRAPAPEAEWEPEVAARRPAPQRSRSSLALPVAAAVVAAAFAVGAAAGFLTDPQRRTAVAPAPSPSASASGAGDLHEALVGRLPAEVYDDCRPDPEREGEGRTASLKCGTPLEGADELLVTQWSDTAAMTANFADVHGGKPDGQCGEYAADPPSGLRSTWGDDAPLACFVNSEPAAILLWEYPEQALQVVAVRRDHGAEGLADDSQALFDWWSTAVTSDPT